MLTDKLSLSTSGASVFALVITLLLAPGSAQGQSDDLNIYGFFQTQYRHVDQESSGEDTGYSSFRLPQLNVFFAKDLGNDFSAFVSTEFLNTYNSGEDWGIARLGEGWLRYEYGRSLKVKGGLLIPKFNNLNEIKNRTPLLPYLTRPYVYEQSYETLIGNGDYVPQRAYAQVYGALPAGDITIDYAAYVGNSEPGFVVSGDASYPVSGTDTTFAKMFGGRVGIQYESLKVGVSGTIDDKNLDQLSLLGSPLPVNLGSVDRYRLGADLSFDVADFFVESEVISVMYSLDDQQEATWDALRQSPQLQGTLGEDLDQLFYYGLVGYQITDKFDVHALYNAIEENETNTILYAFGAGVSYRPVFPVRLKAGYRRSEIQDGSYYGNFFSFGASVTF